MADTAAGGELACPEQPAPYIQPITIIVVVLEWRVQLSMPQTDVVDMSSITNDLGPPDCFIVPGNHHWPAQKFLISTGLLTPRVASFLPPPR